MVSLDISELVNIVAGQDIMEFNIRYATCPGCGGRCKCSVECAVKYWPSMLSIDMNSKNYKNHPRRELADKGNAEFDIIRGKVLTELRKAQELQKNAEVPEGKI